MEKVELTYKQLYDLYGKGGNEIPYEVLDDIFVKTPTNEFVRIDYVVKKTNHEIIRLDFDNNSSFECSSQHLFSCNGIPIMAIDARKVDTKEGSISVSEITPLGNEDVYDISIKAPHWYVTNESGVIHHNTFFSLGIVNSFLEKDESAGVNYNDTESAITKKMMIDRGIDPSRLILSEPSTVQEFRYGALQLLDKYMNYKKKPPLIMVLDSLGQLSTTKEVEDTMEGKETKDMSRAALLKATFRVLNLKLAKAGVALLVTNHVYDVVGSYVPTKEMSGGCLVAGTKIKTENGLQNIETVEEGTKVLTMDGTYQEVLQTHKFDNKKLLEIEFEDGSIVRCSEDHRFLINGQWTEAKYLCENDSVEEV